MASRLIKLRIREVGVGFENVSSIEVPVNLTIREIKKMVEEREGFPVCDQRIVFSGKQLLDERTIADYNLSPENRIDVVLLSQQAPKPAKKET